MRRALLATCLVAAFGALSADMAPASTTGLTRPGFAEEPAPIEPREGGDPEFFRLQLLDFLHESEGVLLRAMELPQFRSALGGRVGVEAGRIPAFEHAEQHLALLSHAELFAVMDLFARAPRVYAVPKQLDQAIGLLELEERRASCEDVYAERRKIEVLTAVRNGLTLGADAVGILKAVSFMIYDLYNAVSTTCETPADIPTSSTQVGVVLIDAVFDILNIGLRVAADEVGFSITPATLCIDSCVGHGFTDYHQPDTNAGLVGKGCDNRDNDCAGGIDEPGEDRVPPTLSVDEGFTARCYRSEADALRTAELAVKASDDCSAVDANVSLAVVPTACRGVLTADAIDGGGNFATLDPRFLTIDPEPPTFVPAPLAACYPSLADARSAFAQATVLDCTATTSQIEVAENACVAELELRAVDACHNEAVLTGNVRLDGTPPDVEIEAIFLPRVDGLACFDTVDRAVETVGEATRFSDDCSARSALLFETRASGPSCDLTVRSTAMDECGLVGSDTVRVRVDDTPPVVSCAVQTNNLWPADDTMRDVGFTYAVDDDCDGSAARVRFEVTSDEATAYGLKVQGTQGEVDPAPDAELLHDASGTVTGLLLRAQRRPDESADGRVYRIRVLATDSCGQESFADCFVTVPHNMSVGSNLGFVYNSGQLFDATGVN